MTAVANLLTLIQRGIDPKVAPELLSVSITNECKWPLRIQSNFFYWKMPFKRRDYMQVVRPLDVADNIGLGMAARRYPTHVAPRTSETFYISDLPTLKQEAKRVREAATLLDRLRFRFIRAYVRADDGETFKVKLSSDIRQVWSASPRS